MAPGPTLLELRLGCSCFALQATVCGDVDSRFAGGGARAAAARFLHEPTPPLPLGAGKARTECRAQRQVLTAWCSQRHRDPQSAASTTSWLLPGQPAVRVPEVLPGRRKWPGDVCVVGVRLCVCVCVQERVPSPPNPEPSLHSNPNGFFGFLVFPWKGSERRGRSLQHPSRKASVDSGTRTAPSHVCLGTLTPSSLPGTWVR